MWAPSAGGESGQAHPLGRGPGWCPPEPQPHPQLCSPPSTPRPWPSPATAPQHPLHPGWPSLGALPALSLGFPACREEDGGKQPARATAARQTPRRALGSIRRREGHRLWGRAGLKLLSESLGPGAQQWGHRPRPGTLKSMRSRDSQTGTVIRASAAPLLCPGSCAVAYAIPTPPPNSSHFTAEDTKAQRGHVTHLRSPSKEHSQDLNPDNMARKGR